jgi:catechol 2,3-dioxygenase-like lactoylglutathione lyase family enzyme
VHDEIPPHYGCDLGGVHFAIHPADGWPGGSTRNARSPWIVLRSADVNAVAARLSARGVRITGPTDHGFGQIVSFRDPDGNRIEIVESAQ